MKTRVTVKNKKQVLQTLTLELYKITNKSRICFKTSSLFTLCLTFIAFILSWFLDRESITLVNFLWFSAFMYTNTYMYVKDDIENIESDSEDIQKLYEKIVMIPYMLQTHMTVDYLLERLDFDIIDLREDRKQESKHVIIKLATRDWNCSVELH